MARYTAKETADLVLQMHDEEASDSEASQVSEDPEQEQDFLDGVDPDLEIPRSPISDGPDPVWVPEEEEDDEEEGQEEDEEEQPSTSEQARKREREESSDRGRGVGRGRGRVRDGREEERDVGRGRGRGRGQTSGDASGQARGRGGGRGRGGRRGRDMSGEPWLGINVEDTYTPTAPEFDPKYPPGPRLLGGVNYSVLDLFHLFITEAMLREIVTNSNLYEKSSHPEAWQMISLEDLYSYICVVVYMGLVDVKTLQDYWSRSELYNFPFPASVISGRKFKAISRTLHLSSPQQDEANDSRRGTDNYDRLCKVKPMYNQIRETCQERFHPRQNVSIDERMVKSKARTPLRQYMKDKPTRWGYKLFVLADSSVGYTWDFFIYEGKGAPIEKGLSYDSVVRLMNVEKLGKGYKLYVDNFYTSPALFRDLLKLKVWACGTIRQQRIGFPRDRPGGLDGRSPRGTIRWLREGPLLFVQWKDTKVVTLCSTIHKAHSGHTVQSKVKVSGQWSVQQISAPPAVSDYNQHMGGVDLSDAMISYYNTLHKTRKWYKTFFYHFLDIAIVNAFILHKELAQERPETVLTQKEFREALVLELKAAGSPSTGTPQAPPRAPPRATH